jgi:hypothetical protein
LQTLRKVADVEEKEPEKSEKSEKPKAEVVTLAGIDPD